MTKPSHSESEYFAKEESEKLHRLAESKRIDEETKDKEQQRTLHYMKCPKCGTDLETIRIEFVDVEKCPECEAIVLDKGELEKLQAADKPFLQSFLNVFRK